MRADRIPPFHKGDMKTFHLTYFSLNEWRKRLYKTIIALVEQNLPTLHYDCHTPILFPTTIRQSPGWKKQAELWHDI